MTEAIKEGLAKLDPKNDNHWTEEGLPRIETMRLLTATPSLAREQITEADPTFNRTRAATPDAPAAGPAVITPASDPVLAPKATEADVPQEVHGRKSVIEMLQDELKEATERCDYVLHCKVAIDQRYEEARAQLDRVMIKLDRLQEPSHKNVMAAIQEYQATANAVRAERGQKWNDLKKAGIRLQDIIPQKAPIDAARLRSKR